MSVPLCSHLCKWRPVEMCSRSVQRSIKCSIKVSRRENSSQTKRRWCLHLLLNRASPKLQKKSADETISACKDEEKQAISRLIFWKIFWWHDPQTLILGRGYGAPSQTPPPSALQRFAPRSGPSVPPSSGRGRVLVWTFLGPAATAACLLWPVTQTRCSAYRNAAVNARQLPTPLLAPPRVATRLLAERTALILSASPAKTPGQALDSLVDGSVTNNFY